MAPQKFQMSWVLKKEGFARLAAEGHSRTEGRCGQKCGDWTLVPSLGKTVLEPEAWGTQKVMAGAEPWADGEGL